MPPAIDASWIRVLSHPTRIALLRQFVVEREASPTTLAGRLDLPLANVSHHVRYLRDARRIVLVRRVPRRGAVEHLYRLSDREETADVLRCFGVAGAPDAAPDGVERGEIDPRSAVLATTAHELGTAVGRVLVRIEHRITDR